MTTIETKKAKNGSSILYVDGKRAKLERLAQQIADGHISPASLEIVGEHGTFVFAGIGENVSRYDNRVLSREYTFVNAELRA